MNQPPEPLRGNILVVDDTPNNLRLLSAMLTEQGYEVRRVISGQMALKTAAANPPDLILLDIKMPDMNGYEVCQHLKASERTREIPVIFISALDEVLDKVKAFAVGGIDYITKPFSEEEVFVRVENSLTIRKLQKQLQEQNERLKQEIAERQQIEVKLQYSEAKYRNLFNNTLVGIFRTRFADGLFLDLNQRLVEMLGYQSVNDLVGQKSSIDHYVNIDYRHQLLTQLQVSGEVHNFEADFYRQDGSVFRGLLSARLNPEDESVEGVVVEIERSEVFKS
ncbi:response regulator [Leptolyngbya sp. NK1-12]|uniref:Response regulator n=1 Tax=Leptolyngbya sp. NK1-12 TaxID=2547451 RepID=A0AA97ANT3_9CYAN|nr:response regulator [Leptolyngbya sp. NK1-12]